MNDELRIMILQKTITHLKENIGSLHVSLAESQAKAEIFESTLIKMQQDAAANEEESEKAE